MSNLISIIIPAYNIENYLERCLKSVIHQTHTNLEIIVVNDGSQDKTGLIADEWAEKDKRIRVVHQENQGVSAARNRGLAIAKGEFVGFVDGDDEIFADMYEFLYANIIKYDADISHCGFELVKPETTVKFHDTGEVLIQKKNEGLSEILSGNRVEPGAWTKLFKKKVLQGVLFPIGIKINEDLLFIVEAFNNADKTVFEDVVKYKYHFVPGSASRKAEVLERERNVFQVAQKIKNILKQPEIQREVDKFYAGKLLTGLKAFKKHGLFKSELAQQYRKELRINASKKLGLRLWVLKILLVDLPIFYDPFIYFYDSFFGKNQKWKNN